MAASLGWKLEMARVLLGAALLCLGTSFGIAEDQGSPASATNDGLYVKVRLAEAIKTSKLKPGDLVQGALSRDVYAGDRKVLQAGTPVRLTVDHLQKRKRAANDHWPGVIKLFTPRHETYPVFKSATALEPSGERSFEVSLVSVNRLREVQARAPKQSAKAPNETGKVEVAKSSKKKTSTPTLVLEAHGLGESADEKSSDEEFRPGATLPVGTQCKILLLGDVSASKSKPGDAVRARLLEPVILNSRVALPAGTYFEGRVSKRTPPKWLSRSGSLYLSFTDLTLPGGNQISIAASLAGAELDAASHTRLDAEGNLHGERPGAAWMAINFGVTAGLAKEVDDGVQLIVEAIVSSATDASTAGTSRIVASAVSGVYMATRKGRDVVLPRFTEMRISLDRPLVLDRSAGTQSVAIITAGK